MTYGSGNYQYEVVEGWGQIPRCRYRTCMRGADMLCFGHL